MKIQIYIIVEIFEPIGRRILKDAFVDARMASPRVPQASARLTCRFKKSVEKNLDASIEFSHMSLAWLCIPVLIVMDIPRI